jgi:NitT/TauT family transport system ATP-binding protein
LAAQGGTAEIFQIAAQTHTAFDLIVRVVKAAEMLDFVDTPKRLVVFTPLGRHFAAAEVGEQKHLWREQVLQLKLFRVVRNLMELHGGHVPKDEVLQEIGARLPMEDPETTFETLVTWGRFGGLFAYSENSNVLSVAGPNQV